MPKTIELSKTASVRQIALGQNNAMAAYLANLYIPIIDAHKGTVVTRYEVANQIAGLHYNEENSNILYACDDSFGLHVFDVRTGSKKKIRMNPDVENHSVTCSSVSKNYVAIASSAFGGGIADVRVSRKKEQHPHVVSLFDIRSFNEPLTTYARRHTEEITCMSFYKNGTDLMTGSTSGAVRSFNCDRRDEDNAIRWERWIKGPVTNLGLINKRIAFAIGDKSECNVFIDSKNELEVLYGNVMTTATEKSKKPSPATFTKPKFVMGLVKGMTDELPLISVWGTEGDNKLHLTAMDQSGICQTKNMADYVGHEGVVKCMAADVSRLVTGGEDGKIIIKSVDFRSDGGGKSSKSDKSVKTEKSVTDVKASRSNSDKSVRTSGELKMSSSDIKASRSNSNKSVRTSGELKMSDSDIKASKSNSDKSVRTSGELKM